MGTDWGLIAIRFSLYANLMLLVGMSSFALYALMRTERETTDLLHRFARWLRWLAVVGLAVSTVGFAALAANMFGIGLFALDGEMLATMVTDTPVGMAWQWRSAALLMAVLAALRATRNPTPCFLVVAVTGSVALATLAWSGHAGATEGMVGSFHRLSDIVHLLAAAVWLGAIVAFHLLLTPSQGVPPADKLRLAHRALDQFAKVGTICVLLIVATGLFNSQMIVGIANLTRAMSAPYGQMLLLKLVLFAAMLILAAFNRWRLTPALAKSGGGGLAVAAIKRSLWLETLAGGGVLALVAGLGMLQPFD